MGGADRSITWRAALAASALVAAAVPVSPQLIEHWYSTALYLRLQRALTPVTNLVPLALLDVLILSGGAAAVGIVRRGARIGAGAAARQAAAAGLTAAAGGYLLFLCTWGLNYRRVPLEQKLDYEAGRVTGTQALALAAASAEGLNATFAAAHASTWKDSTLAAPFANAQRALAAAPLAVPGVPKRSMLGWYFRRAAIDGMTDPFFLEVILNPDLLDVERPFVLAHEWAHLAGYAAESEASFVAWVTCLKGDARARYSAWLTSYGQAMRTLPPESRRLVPPLAPGPAADLRAIGARYRRSSPIVRGAAREVYDGYLRANRVREGIESYDGVVRLMLGTRFGPGWTPRLR